MRAWFFEQVVVQDKLVVLMNYPHAHECLYKMKLRGPPTLVIGLRCSEYCLSLGIYKKQ